MSRPLSEPPALRRRPLVGKTRQVGYGATFWWNGGSGAAAVSPAPGRPGRRPGHSSTREEIARAAREQFAAGGYDRVTLRAVAAQAGVDAALVAYFFGSKRELFDEVVNPSSDSSALIARLLDGDPRLVGERLARLVIEALDDTGRRERILGTIRTAAVEADTARKVGEKFTTELLEPVVSQLGVAQAPCAPRS